MALVAEAVETIDHVLPARGFVTGNPTIIEVEQRAKVGAEEIVTAVAKALESEFGPAPVKLQEVRSEVSAFIQGQRSYRGSFARSPKKPNR